MKIYTLDESNQLNLEAPTKWRLQPETSVEDAIRDYAGIVTFQIQWDVDGVVHALTVRSYKETSLIADKVADAVIAKLKNIFE